MNKIMIADIIVRKRREKGITQDEMAAYLGVSKAAVSKWENNQCYPDIALLPVLASYFNISIDELLGYTPQLTREERWRLCAEVSTGFITKPFDEVMSDIREAAKKYYSCFPLLYQLAVLIVNHHTLVAVGVNQSIALEEAKTLCERVVSESGDAVLSNAALHVQCMCHLLLSEPEEVLTLIGDSLQAPEMTDDSLISQAYELLGNYDKAKEITQCGMYIHLMCLVEAITNYISLTDEDFETAEPSLMRAEEMIRLFNVEKLDANASAKIYLCGASLYCKHGRPEKALEILERYTDLCVSTMLPFGMRGDSFFTDVSEWLNSGELGASIQYDKKMIKHNMLQGLYELPALDVLRNEPRYKAVEKRLKELKNEAER